MKRKKNVSFRSTDDSNARLDEVLCAETVAERARGLLGRAPLCAGQGMYLSPCRSVHSFGMSYALDLVYIDRLNRVCKVVYGFQRWRVSVSLRARSTLELKAGEARRLGISVGQEVVWDED